MSDGGLRPERRSARRSPGGPFQATFPCTVGRVSDVRRSVRRFMLAQGAREAEASDLELIVSELFTNAAEHGVGETISITIDASSALIWTVEITCALVEQANRARRPASWEPPAPWARSGRGLGIVRALLHDVRVSDDATTFTVSGRLARRARSSPPSAPPSAPNASGPSGSSPITPSPITPSPAMPSPAMPSPATSPPPDSVERP